MNNWNKLTSSAAVYKILNSLKPPRLSQLGEILLISLMGSVLILTIGFSSGLLQYKPVEFSISLYLKEMTRILIFPAAAEEILVRVLILPDLTDAANQNARRILFPSIVSLSIYVFYHIPAAWIIDHVNNLLGNSTNYFMAFTNFPFLFCTFLLGFVCTINYLRTSSIVPSICFHWVAVVVWLLLLDGMNKLHMG